MRWGVGAAVAASLAAGLAAATPAVAARAMPADAFTATVGVNTHMMFHDTPYKDLGATIDALRWLGVRQVRDGISAPAPPRGAWYRRDQARRFTAMGKAGIRLALIAGGPDRDGDTLSARLNEARRLPGLLALEGPNEWDLNGGDDWASTLPELQRRLYAAVQDDPGLQVGEVKVYGPSFGRLENAAKVGDLSDALDVGNLHAYTGGRQPEEAEELRPATEGLPDRLRTARRLSGRAPLVMTEVGFHNAFRQLGRMPHVPEDVAAVYTLRTVLEHARLGIRRTYLYELFDSYSDPLQVNAEAQFGLFDHDRRPKPAATALRRLLRLLRETKRSPKDARVDVGVEGDDDLRSLLIARSGKRYSLVLWRATPIWEPELKQPIDVGAEPVSVSLPATFGDVRARRPVEGDDPQERWSDVDEVEVPVGASPVVVELRQGAAASSGASPRTFAVPLPFL